MKYFTDVRADIDTAELTEAAAPPAPATGDDRSRDQTTLAAMRRAPRHRRRRSLPHQALRGFGAGADTMSRLRLVGWTALGVACLLAVHLYRPDNGSLFALPSDPAGWAWVACGLIGVWLVPGLWMSAVLMRAGAGPTAWLATRIGTGLAWYALVGPVLHQLGQGARVTTGGILVTTIAAAAAVCLGVLLGLVRRPARSWQRAIACAVIAGALAQVVIWTSTRVWSYGMNYAHIHRLDWLIVLGCALLAVAGMLNRPQQPPQRTRRGVLQLVVAVSILAAMTSALVLTSATWSPEQRMPSALSLEQVPSAGDAALAFAVTGIGSDGPALVDHARYTVSDDTGRLLAAEVTVVRSPSDPSQATLLVRFPPNVLCNTGSSVKVTVRDVSSGVRVQGSLPERRCEG